MELHLRPAQADCDRSVTVGLALKQHTGWLKTQTQMIHRGVYLHIE